MILLICFFVISVPPLVRVRTEDGGVEGCMLGVTHLYVPSCKITRQRERTSIYVSLSIYRCIIYIYIYIYVYIYIYIYIIEREVCVRTCRYARGTEGCPGIAYGVLRATRGVQEGYLLVRLYLDKGTYLRGAHVRAYTYTHDTHVVHVCV